MIFIKVLYTCLSASEKIPAVSIILAVIMATPNPRSVELEVMTRNYAKLCEILSPVIDGMLPKLLREHVIIDCIDA